MNAVRDMLAPLKRRVVELEDVENKRLKCDNDIDVAIVYLKTKFMTYEQVVKNFKDINKKPEFWVAFSKATYEMPLFRDRPVSSDVHDCFGSLRNIDAASLTTVKRIASKYEVFLLFDLLEQELMRDTLSDEGREIAKEVSERFPFFFLNYFCYSDRRWDKIAYLLAPCLERLPLWDPLYRQCLTDGTLPPPDSEPFWQSRDVAIAWGRGGGPFLSDTFPVEFQDDQEVVVAFLDKPRIGRDQKVSLMEIPDHLRSDKTFMLAAIRSHPFHILEIADTLVGDLDLLFAALCDDRSTAIVYSDPTSSKFGRWYKRDGEHDCDLFWCHISNTVRQELYKYKVFMKVVLAAMSIKPESSKSSVLSMLCQGQDTSLGYKKRIAEYAGIPLGEKLLLYSAVSKTLALGGWWYPWDD